MSNNFIRLDNNFFRQEDNIFNYIGTEGFTLYCYLLIHQSNTPYAEVSIRQIQSCLSRNYAKRPSLVYSEKKINKISCLKDKKTMTKYLKTLVRMNLIEIVNLEDISNKQNTSIENIVYEKININQILMIKCKENNYPNGWESISSYLFMDYIHKIGHIGWSILCLLSKLHNKSFGGEYSEGFANPTEEYIGKILLRNKTTIGAYLHLLEETKLIKIEPQEIYIKINKHGNEEPVYLPNHYIVKNQLKENKYYIEKEE